MAFDTQNRRQKVFNKGGFAFLREWGVDILKIDKKSTDV